MNCQVKLKNLLEVLPHFTSLKIVRQERECHLLFYLDFLLAAINKKAEKLILPVLKNLVYLFLSGEPAGTAIDDSRNQPADGGADWGKGAMRPIP